LSGAFAEDRAKIEAQADSLMEGPTLSTRAHRGSPSQAAEALVV
jgi:hypothetical protein